MANFGMVSIFLLDKKSTALNFILTNCTPGMRIRDAAIISPYKTKPAYTIPLYSVNK